MPAKRTFARLRTLRCACLRHVSAAAPQQRWIVAHNGSESTCQLPQRPQNASLAEILSVVAEEVGRKPPKIKIPRGAMVPFAYLTEAIASFTGKEPMLTHDGLKMSKNKMFFSSAKAERELGYRARPYAEGVRDAIGWFRKAGYLKS